ncbi:MAG: hypothetical protein JW815_04405 [Candidatus Bathyarchaeota archaeon]|nr:hypothetical protein [Candidatus Bathyarchaeum sp.]
MYHKLVLEPTFSQLQLSLNIENVDNLFSGFMLGDFAVLRGFSVNSLLSSLCVRAQLPYQLGGLETNVLFIDGGNSFRLYEISLVAQACELDPKEVLERIYVSRAFTAYQLTSLVLEQLQNAIEKFDSKLIILSNLAQLYLDKDIPKKEAEDVFLQLTKYLADFANKNHVILVATHPPRSWSKNSRFFEEVLCSRAYVVATIRKFRNRPHFVLEKHPSFKLGKVELPSEEVTLLDFLEG